MLFCIAILCVVYCVYYVYDWWIRRAWVDSLHRKAVFITGCDSGFGNATARSLYRRGVYVYAGCYTESGAQRLQEETGERLRTVILDVTNSQSIQQAYQTVVDTLPAGVEFWGLVNNAGIMCHIGVLECTTMEEFKRVFDVNFFGMVEMTKVFLSLMKRSQGRVVNTASLASDMPAADMIPYCASKWAVKAFSESFRIQKAVWGVKVATIQPAAFKTEIVSMNMMNDRTKQAWNNTDQHVRDEYGPTYMDEKVNEILETMDAFTVQDLSSVVNVYEHALFAVHPYKLYYPGGLLKYIPNVIIENFLVKVKVPAAMLK